MRKALLYSAARIIFSSSCLRLQSGAKRNVVARLVVVVIEPINVISLWPTTTTHATCVCGRSKNSASELSSLNIKIFVVVVVVVSLFKRSIFKEEDFCMACDAATTTTTRTTRVLSSRRLYTNVYERTAGDHHQHFFTLQWHTPRARLSKNRHSP